MLSLKMFFKRRELFIGVLIITYLAYFIWYSYVNQRNDIYSGNTQSSDHNISKEETCVLPKIDPWDLSIRRYLDPEKDPLKDCTVKFKTRSLLDASGYLSIVNRTKDETCNYRCIDSFDGSNLVYAEWLEITGIKTKVECDVFEVACLDSKTKSETYSYLHAQIVPIKLNEPATDAPDVYIILIDSTSIQHFQRAMPATTEYLRTKMKASMFHYYNKVARNSRPNMYPLLFGEQSEDIEANPWGPRVVIKGRNDELCAKPLDDENFIFFDFEKQDYVSLWTEDWWDAVTRWPNCVGFKEKKHAHHFMQSFAMRAWKNESDGLWAKLFTNQCRETFNYVLDTLSDFVGKYPRPKISLSWVTNLAHNDANNMYHTDHQFKEFFQKMHSNFSNAFIFFMSDHGNHYLLPTNTLIGEIEVSNPFLFVIVPEKLRENEDLTTQLHVNSHKLITHYDVYATLLEIAANGPNWGANTVFSNKTYESYNRVLKGSSLFHKLDEPRTCERLFIPFSYCICQHEYKEFIDAEIAVKIAEAVVHQMNVDLQASEFASKCVNLTVNRNETAKLKIREYERQGSKRIFRSTIITLPSNGTHDAFAEMLNGKVTLISTRFLRNNAYKEHAHCIKENFLSNYCYCVDLLDKNES